MKNRNHEQNGLQNSDDFSPKLRMAGAEIKEIFEKYDIAGVAMIAIPGFNEYQMHINTTWSLAHLNQKKELVISDPIVDPNDEAPAKKKIGETVNVIANMRIWVGKLAGMLTQADVAVRTKFNMMPQPPKNNFPPGGPNFKKK